MGNSDGLLRHHLQNISAMRRATSVLVLDLIERKMVTTSDDANTMDIILTEEDVEDLAPHIADIVITAIALNNENLSYSVVVQHRTLGTDWVDPPADYIILANITTSALTINDPWAHREVLGRKFRLVLRVKAATDAYAKALMTVSAAIRLLT